MGIQLVQLTHWVQRTSNPDWYQPWLQRSTIQKFEQNHAMRYSDVAAGKVRGKGNWKRLLPRALCRIGWLASKSNFDAVVVLSLCSDCIYRACNMQHQWFVFYWLILYDSDSDYWFTLNYIIFSGTCCWFMSRVISDFFSNSLWVPDWILKIDREGLAATCRLNLRFGHCALSALGSRLKSKSPTMFSLNAIAYWNATTISHAGKVSLLNLMKLSLVYSLRPAGSKTTWHNIIRTRTICVLWINKLSIINQIISYHIFRFMRESTEAAADRSKNIQVHDP